MAAMKELYTTAPDALRLATEALRREVRAGEVDLSEHEDAIETLEVLMEFFEYPVRYVASVAPQHTPLNDVGV